MDAVYMMNENEQRLSEVENQIAVNRLRSDNVEASVARLVAEMDQLRSETALLGQGGMHYGYDGPFCGRVDPADGALYIGQGYIYAGANAEWNWPGSSDDNTPAVSGLGDGVHLVLFEVTVDAEWGYFTSADKPELTTTLPYDPYFGIQSTLSAKVIVGRARVVGGRVVQWRQDLRGNIYVPVRNVEDSNSVNSYYATWANSDKLPDGTVSDPVTTPTELHGNESDAGGPWPWT